ncbi:MAG: hypothetical protein HC827_14010 [Cyanobacteria bacterium RM1_2_2]|nr:hypothetical protein [Cyanobacteria bacterium RM1_2_2]
MSALPSSVCSGAKFIGGVVSYPLDLLYEEVAFIAFHFHWSQEEILNLDHRRRQRWVSEISKINQQWNQTDNGIVQLVNAYNR